MEEVRKDNTLTNQTISKLLDFQNLPVAEDSSTMQFLRSGTSKKPNYSEAISRLVKQAPTPASIQMGIQRSLKRNSLLNRKRVFIISWIVMFLVIWAIAEKLGFKMPSRLSFNIVEKTYGNSGMFLLAGCALSLITWLYCKNRLRKIANTAVIIGVVLLVTLPILTMSTGGVVEVKGLNRALSQFSLGPSTPMLEPVTGIIYSEDKPSAILGGRIVHEGDVLNGVHIIRIYKNEVELEWNGRNWTQAVREVPKAY